MKRFNIKIEYIIPGKFRNNKYGEIQSPQFLRVLNSKTNKFAKISFKIAEIVEKFEPVDSIKLWIVCTHNLQINCFAHIAFKRDVSNAERKKFLKYLKHYPNYGLAKYIHIFRFRRSGYIGWKKFNIKQIHNVWEVERKTNDKLRKIKKEI